MHIFLFGSGYSASYFIKALQADPELKISAISGTARSDRHFDQMRQAGINPLLFDTAQGFSDELLAHLSRATHIVSSIAPHRSADTGCDPVISLMKKNIRTYAPAVRWLGYLSTLSVYGDYQGQWIDETSALKPQSDHSKARILAEQQWLQVADEAALPCAIFRIAGIYGPTFQNQARNALLNLQQGRTRRIDKAGHVFNRIHVADIGGAVAHLARREQGGIFNLADDEPASASDVTAYAAQLMQLSLPDAIPFEQAGLSEMARSFYTECKRASNQALKSTGYQLIYPDYRTGLNSLWASGEGKS